APADRSQTTHTRRLIVHHTRRLTTMCSLKSRSKANRDRRDQSYQKAVQDNKPTLEPQTDRGSETHTRGASPSPSSSDPPTIVVAPGTKTTICIQCMLDAYVTSNGTSYTGGLVADDPPGTHLQQFHADLKATKLRHVELERLAAEIM